MEQGLTVFLHFIYRYRDFILSIDDYPDKETSGSSRISSIIYYKYR